LLLLLSAAYLEERATITNFREFGLTQLGLEPTISTTQGKHANHYYATSETFSSLYLQPDTEQIMSLEV
jgi:hypothetical protein